MRGVESGGARLRGTGHGGDDTALVSCLCQLDLGYMVVEDAGELIFWNCLRDPSESPEEVRAQLVRMLQCPSRVVLWPSRSVWVA